MSDKKDQLKAFRMLCEQSYQCMNWEFGYDQRAIQRALIGSRHHHELIFMSKNWPNPDEDTLEELIRIDDEVSGTALLWGERDSMLRTIIKFGDLIEEEVAKRGLKRRVANHRDSASACEGGDA